MNFVKLGDRQWLYDYLWKCRLLKNLKIIPCNTSRYHFLVRKVAIKELENEWRIYQLTGMKAAWEFSNRHYNFA
jgi:hypothetical protein